MYRILFFAAVIGLVLWGLRSILKDWRNKKILDEAPEEVVAIRFENTNGAFSFLRGGEGAWTQAEGETPIERFGSTRVQSLVSSLANMRAVDFAAADVDHSAAGFDEPTGTVTLEIREGEAPAPEPAEEGPIGPRSAPHPGDGRP